MLIRFVGHQGSSDVDDAVVRVQLPHSRVPFCAGGNVAKNGQNELGKSRTRVPDNKFRVGVNVAAFVLGS
jgi:hypothetical protein